MRKDVSKVVTTVAAVRDPEGVNTLLKCIVVALSSFRPLCDQILTFLTIMY